MDTDTPEIKVEPLLAICLFASFADGDKSDEERSRVEALAAELGGGDVAAVARRILMGRTSLAMVADEMKSREERLLAYEMARAVCEASGSISAEEQDFLNDLKGRLALSDNEATACDRQVDALALAAPESPGPVSESSDSSAMILRYSILNGALELLPETLATMAILPLQMKMVWRIGKAHGFEADRSSIKEFLATAGLGLGSQVLEGFARKLVGGLGRRVGGSFAGKLANQATGSAFSFASTYAIGHLAARYYAGGRKLGGAELKSLYSPMDEEARHLHAKYAPEIQQRASTLDPAAIMDLVRGKSAV